MFLRNHIHASNTILVQAKSRNRKRYVKLQHNTLNSFMSYFFAEKCNKKHFLKKCENFNKVKYFYVNLLDEIDFAISIFKFSV